MPDNKPLEVGDDVFLRPINVNNRARSGRNLEIVRTKIKKIGRKYFETEESHRGRFYLTTLRQDGGDYSPNYQAYLTMQEILDEQEKEKLYTALVEKIKWNNPFTLEQLREIAKIIAP